jgi:hypothetical protein
MEEVILTAEYTNVRMCKQGSEGEQLLGEMLFNSKMRTSFTHAIFLSNYLLLK